MAPIYYVNCAFAWVTVVLAIIGFVYTLRQTGEKWAFWPIFGTGWAMFAISHSMKLAGVDTGTPAPTVIRIIGYSLVVIAVISLILRARRALR